jgi:hypothetical protein
LRRTFDSAIFNRVKISKYIFPLLSIWTIAGYIHLIQCLVVAEVVSSPIIMFLLFVPVVFMEIGWSYLLRIKIYPDYKLSWISHPSLMIGRIIFWFAVFYGWVYIVGRTGASVAVWMKWMSPQFYIAFYLIFRLQFIFALAAFAIWLLLYLFITVRTGVGRLTICLVLPALVTFGLFYQFNNYGGIGGLYGDEAILAQLGVSRIFEVDELNLDAPVSSDPRDIFVDEQNNILYATFGASFHDWQDGYASLIRYDIKSTETHYYRSSNIRKISVHGNMILAAPALGMHRHLYLLAATDLTVQQSIPHQKDISITWWEPLDVHIDLSENKFYIFNNVSPFIFAYDLATGRLEKTLDLQAEGLVGIGGNAENVRQSKTTRTLYLSSGPGENLLAIDPDSLKVLKKTYFPGCIMGSALELSESNSTLYVQCGAVDDLYEIDIETFAVKRKFEGEFHSKIILLDQKRNCLYVLGFASGTLFPIDLSTGKRAWTLKVGGKPNGMFLDSDDRIWINSLSGILLINLQSVWKDHISSKEY